MPDKAALFTFAWRAFAPPDAGVDWIPEYVFHPKRKWRFDFALLEQLIACEVDGGQWSAGGGRHNRDSDRTKMNHAAALGWRVFRFSTQQLEADPAACVRLICQALNLPFIDIE